MGRKKKSLIEKSPFKLRHRKLADGRLSLFLDRSVDGGHEYEFLQLYLMPETSAKARRQNAQTLRKAEDIQRERTEALLNAKVGTVPESKSSDMLLSDWMFSFRTSVSDCPKVPDKTLIAFAHHRCLSHSAFPSQNAGNPQIPPMHPAGCPVLLLR